MNAYILCGGESKRMGKPKATLLFEGLPMAVHIAQIAKAAGFSPFLVVKESQNFQFPYPTLIDQEEKTHPISGILRAMEHCSDSLFLILPCDTPFLTKTSVAQFLDAQIPMIASDGDIHPLMGIYSTQDKDRAKKALQQNLSMKKFSRDFPTVSFPSEELHNCNRPNDL